MNCLRQLVSLLCIFTLLAPTAISVGAQETPQAVPAAIAPAAASTSTPAPAVVSPQVSPNKIVLKEGTEVNLKFAQKLSSKTAAVGDHVQLVLDEDIRVGDAVVAKKGAYAFGTVTNVRKSGMAGRGGELNVQIDYLKAGDNNIRLRGVQGKQGANKDAATVGLVFAFGVIGFLKHGKQAEVKKGAPLEAYVDQDTEITVQN